MIKVYCKEGVWFKFISYEFLTLARVVYRVYEAEGIIPTITSACDSQHGEGSLHPRGLAWDWRIWGLKDPQRAANEIRREVQAIDYHYDIVFGDEKHLDHIHTEYDENKKQ